MTTEDKDSYFWSHVWHRYDQNTLQTTIKKTRKCLRCRMEFRSSGSRICSRHEESLTYEGPVKEEAKMVIMDKKRAAKVEKYRIDRAKRKSLEMLV